MADHLPDNQITACQACGASWSDGSFSEDCEQCGGGGMTRDCAWCQGSCGRQWQRRVLDSWDFNEAQWIAGCGAKCSTCQAAWGQHQHTPDCDECGGGSMLRLCPDCDGECRAPRTRDVPATWQAKHAIWLGSCTAK